MKEKVREKGEDKMIEYFCDKCKKRIEKASGVIIPRLDTKEFCCYNCAQQYMEEKK
ncbi:MAG: hypothetical protein P1P85_01800 [Patescibacteria group bacterium]|nr:hypothetical protein [Patescibacteria group bacterium]